MKINNVFLTVLVSVFIWGCAPNTENVDEASVSEVSKEEADDGFQYLTEQFGDIRVLRYKIPGFEELELKQKELLYYLYQAAQSGRDIIYDQNYKHNLCVRKTLETIVNTYAGDKATKEYEQFMVYAKRIWFSNGIHHHYSTKKIMPDFPSEYLAELVKGSDEAALPLQEGEDVEASVETPEEVSDKPKSIKTTETVEFSAEEELENLKAENEKLKTELAEQPAEAPINTNKFSSDKPIMSKAAYNRLPKRERILMDLDR